MICFCERISPPQRRGRVPPCGAGSFSTWKRNQKTLWGGRNRQERRCRPCLHAALPLEPPLRGTRTCEVEQNFRRAKMERLSAVPSGPLGPGFAKIAAAAAPQPRLALPNQRLRCGFRRRGGCPHPPARWNMDCGPREHPHPSRLRRAPPTPLVPLGHFPLIGGIVLSPWGKRLGRLIAAPTVHRKPVGAHSMRPPGFAPGALARQTQARP